MSIRDQIAAGAKRFDELEKKMSSIQGSIKGEKRQPTASESAALKDAGLEIAEILKDQANLKYQLEIGEKATAQLDEIAGIGGGDSSGRLVLAGRGVKSLARGAARDLLEHAVERGSKALVTYGTANVPVPTTTAPIPLGQPVTSLLEALQAHAAPPVYQYARQTVRENNAAVVEPGGTKPTSVMTIETIQSELKVIAHLTEAIDKFMLEDSETLATFIEQQMFRGIHRKLQALIVGPAGATTDIPSLQSITGVRSQAYATDVLTTLRAAMTQLEIEGYQPGVFSLHPTVWASIETARNSSGQFDLGPTAPVDAAARRIWGVPVALVPEQAAGSGFLIDTATIDVRYHQAGIAAQWDGGGELFEKNQVRGRVEGRFQVDYLQPGGNVIIDLTA